MNESLQAPGQPSHHHEARNATAYFDVATHTPFQLAKSGGFLISSRHFST